VRAIEALSADRVAAALGGAVVVGAIKGADRALPQAAGASIDTRTLRAGDIFFALPGERADGHAFVEAAFARGAAFAVVRDRSALPAGRTGVVVADAARALFDLAAAVRATLTCPIAAVTGSMGKTTTKELLAAMLRTRGPVLATRGNLNNLLGVPLTILEADADAASAVLECGMSEKGELARLSALVRPDVAVVTNVAPVHLEFFDSVDGIADAKCEIFEGLAPSGRAIVPAGDPRLEARTKELAAQRHRTTFGIENGDVRAARVAFGPDGTTFELSAGNHAASARLRAPGRPAVLNALAAAAAALSMGVPLRDIAGAIDSFSGADRRGVRLRLSDDILLVDDSYNSNPEALVAAVETLALSTGRRRVACVGDMLELGPSGADLHRDVGRRIAPLLDVLLGCGPLSASLVEAAAAIPPEHRRSFGSSVELAAEIDAWIRPRDLVLVKGSRGSRMERVVEAIERRHPVAAEARA
jgi:UDP-N-acetylmuramoyl-tripeptide--D-alanyl-D-alanine ligase